MQTESGATLTPTHLVSALPLPALDKISSSALPHLTAEPTSTVTVVNIVFPGASTALHPPGFGYLIPRPSAYADSSRENPLGVLGTVFDSCALSTQDAGAPVTKITMMLGGPYYAARPALTPVPSTTDPDPEFVRRLLDVLAHHLGTSRARMPEPLLVRVRTHPDCIPTPTPGHEARVAQLRAAVRERWGGAAAVIGAGVGGVSVPACVEAGRTVGIDW